MKIVSACLAGIPCRFNWTAKPCPYVIQLVQQGEALPLCPEELWGLSTPRDEAEIQKDGCVKTITGLDVTKQYRLGAQKVLDVAKNMWCTEVIFRQKSPSCGCGEIFDGTFTEKLVHGDGICTQLLKENGVKVITEKDL